MGAGGGCFGLAIQDYCAVHACVSFGTGALCAGRMRDGEFPVNRNGKAHRPVHADSWVAKSNMPYPPFLFCSDRECAAWDLKGFEKCS